MTLSTSLEQAEIAMSDAVMTITANDIAEIIESRAEVEDGYLGNAGYIAHEIYLTMLAASTLVGGWEQWGWRVRAKADAKLRAGPWSWQPDALTPNTMEWAEQEAVFVAPPPPSGSIDNGSRPQEAVPTEQAETAVVARLVDRFLSWKLPETFNPDGAVFFDKERMHPAHWPSGTNLLDHTQATEMVRHMLAGEPR